PGGLPTSRPVMLPLPSTGSSLTRCTFTVTPVSCGPNPSMARFTRASRDAYSHHSAPAAASMRPAAPINTAVRSPKVSSVQLHVFVFHRQVVDAPFGRRDPAGHLARLGHLVHERADECLVLRGGNPVFEMLFKESFFYLFPLRVDRNAGPRADRAAKARGGESEAHLVPGALDQPVPALEADLAVLEVRLAHDLVQRVEQGNLLGLSVRQFHLENRGAQPM